MATRLTDNAVLFGSTVTIETDI